MTNHQKRLSVPKSWPVERKTETFTVKASAGPHGEAGVPLLILLRDVLGYVDNRKEARFALAQDNVIINGTPVSDEERPVGMFDIVVFDERDEYYRVFPDEGGRLMLTPIAEDAAESKLGKIDGKRHVPGGDVQLTLHDGHTLLVEVDSDYEVGDSIVIGNEDDEIVAHFDYEEGALATAVAGKHAGRIGTIDEIQVTASSSQNNVLLEGDDGGFETVEDYIVIIDENFTSDDDGSPEAAADGADESSDDDADESAADDTDESSDDDADESAADDADDSAADDADESADDDTDEPAAEDAADTEDSE